MTHSDRRDILDAIHQLELRFTDRLARLEVKVEGQAELKKRVEAAEAAQAVHEQVMWDRTNRLLIGLTIVAILALGDLATRAIVLF